MNQVHLSTLPPGIDFIYHHPNGNDIECRSVGKGSYEYFDNGLGQMETLYSPTMLCDITNSDLTLMQSEQRLSKHLRHRLHVETGE